MVLLPRWLEILIAVVSVLMFVGSLVAIPVFLVKIPADHFTRERERARAPARIARTILGVFLVLLGLAMLVLPGQGLLTVLVGLGLLDLPVKRRLIRKILLNAKVHAAIDGLRRKHGKAPLLVPPADEPVPGYA